MKKLKNIKILLYLDTDFSKNITVVLNCYNSLNNNYNNI